METTSTIITTFHAITLQLTITCTYIIHAKRNISPALSKAFNETKKKNTQCTNKISEIWRFRLYENKKKR